MRQALIATVLLLTLSGCVRRRAAVLPPRPLIPPPPVERQLKITEITDPPPQIDLPQPDIPSLQMEMPTARPPRVRAAKPVVVRKKEAPEPSKPSQPKPYVPGFRLGEVLTPAQRLEMNQQTDAYLASSEQAARTASAKLLNPDQLGLLSQVRSLVEQSRRARSTDLVESRKLAERAKTLADALLGSLTN